MRFFLENGSEGEISAVFAAVKDFDPQPFEEEASALGRDESRPALLRVRALRISGSRGNSIDAEAFDLLASLLEDPGASPGERIEACRLLAEGRLDREQTLRAAAFMAGAGPLEFPVLFEAVRPRRDDLEIGERLARAYLEAPGAGAVPARERQRLLTVSHAPEFWREWVERLDEHVRGEAETAQRVSRLEAAVVAGEGDAERGREIAMAAASTCVACHRVGEAGIHVGPDLSRIGRIRTARDLVESILLPSATIAQEYEGKVLTTTDGEILGGVIRSESPDAVEIGLAAGEFRSVPRSGIRSLEPLPVSLMPEGLDRIFTEEQLVDLVTYLKSLR